MCRSEVVVLQEMQKVGFMEDSTKKKIFISGSKSISKLTDKMLAVLDKIMRDGDTILVGDCYGADLAVQKYLLKNGYTDVVVYCSGEQPRNYVVGTILSCANESAGLKGRAFQYVKDAAMCDDCDEAYGFWDGKSPGTLDNALRVMQRNKKFHYVFSEGVLR